MSALRCLLGGCSASKALLLSRAARTTVQCPRFLPAAAVRSSQLASSSRFVQTARVLRQETKGEDRAKDVTEHQSQPSEVSTARKVVEAGKDVSYLAVILLGGALTCVFAYSLYNELSGSSSTDKVFSKALKQIANDDKVQAALGDQIKGYGEGNSSGRRRHIASQEYEVNGEVYIRMRFYCEGSKGHGTVHCEVHKKRWGYDYRYLFVEVPGLGPSPEVIFLEDNR